MNRIVGGEINQSFMMILKQNVGKGKHCEYLQLS